MLDEPLGADLETTERDVRSLMRLDVGPALGRRIASAVRGELRRERSAARGRFVLALAAGAMMWIHVSFYAASVTDFHFRPARSCDNGDAIPRWEQVFPKATSGPIRMT